MSSQLQRETDKERWRSRYNIICIKKKKNYISIFYFKINNKQQQENTTRINCSKELVQRQCARASARAHSLAREERESSRTNRNRGRREGTKMRRDKKIGAWISLRDPQVNLDFTSLIGHRGPQMSNVEA